MSNGRPLERLLSVGAFLVRIPGIWIIQIASIAAILLIGALPAWFVYELFPAVWERYGRMTSEGIWSYVDEIGFVALVGALGLAPFFFSKSIDVIPKVIGAMFVDLRKIVSGPWLPPLQLSDGHWTTFALARERASGILSTARSAVPLIVGFTGVAVALKLALVVASDPVSPKSESSVGGFASGSVYLRFDEGNGWTEEYVRVPRCFKDLEADEKGEPADAEADLDGADAVGALALDAARNTVSGVSEGEPPPIEEVIVIGSTRTAVCFESSWGKPDPNGDE